MRKGSYHKFDESIHGLPVEGFGNRYSVTKQGEVWSFGRNEPFKLSQSISRGNYPFVYLYKDQKPRFVLVHRAVLLTFVGPPEQGEVAMHMDGNPGNNSLDNLKWGTELENQSHRVLHGTSNRGERSYSAKVSLDTAQSIWDKVKKEGISRKEAASKFNVSLYIVHHILRGATWPEIDRSV